MRIKENIAEAGKWKTPDTDEFKKTRDRAYVMNKIGKSMDDDYYMADMDPERGRPRGQRIQQKDVTFPGQPQPEDRSDVDGSEIYDDEVGEYMNYRKREQEHNKKYGAPHRMKGTGGLDYEHSYMSDDPDYTPADVPIRKKGDPPFRFRRGTKHHGQSMDDSRIGFPSHAKFAGEDPEEFGLDDDHRR
jgi:hypothetical protein